MNRPLHYLVGPEAALALFTAGVFWFCARHNSGEGRDVAIMEKLIWAIPFLLTPIAFATLAVPGAKNWWWLGRAIVSTYLAVFVCGYRLIGGLGSGAKGQDAAFILLIVLGAFAIALASAVAGALILATTKPAFASWFQAHRILGSIITLVAAVPLGFVFALGVTFVGGTLLGIYAEFTRR